MVRPDNDDTEAAALKLDDTWSVLQYISSRSYLEEDRTYQRLHPDASIDLTTARRHGGICRCFTTTARSRLSVWRDSAGCKNYFKNEFGIELDDYLSWDDDRTDELLWATAGAYGEATGNGGRLSPYCSVS